MLIIEILKESQPRTLYHGTIKEFLPDILHFGLSPNVGNFVQHAYREYKEAGIDLPDIIFAANKKGIGKCVSAIIGQIKQRFPNIKTLTSTDFYKHAAIVVMKHSELRFKYRGPEDHQLIHPPHVEPEDYYRDINIMPDFVLSDKKLNNFLMRNNIQLSDYGIVNK